MGGVRIHIQERYEFTDRDDETRGRSDLEIRFALVDLLLGCGLAAEIVGGVEDDDKLVVLLGSGRFGFGISEDGEAFAINEDEFKLFPKQIWNVPSGVCCEA